MASLDIDGTVVGLRARWVGRRPIFRADVFAPDRVGVEHVIDLLEWRCVVTDRPLKRGRLWSLQRMAPGPATRIDRLLDRGTTQ